MNKNIKELNNDVPHKPIYKVRTYEPKGNKYAIGQTGNKKDKYVEAAKGTNLFFAIYQADDGKRSYETIPLNIVIERQKLGLSSVPETDEKGNKLLFHLSPYDLVYVPNKEENENIKLINFENLTNEQAIRIFTVNDFSGYTIYFTPNRFAKAIAPKELDTSFDSKLTKCDDNPIKDVCIKIFSDRLGNIKIKN